MSRSIIDIASDLALAKHDLEMGTEEDFMQRVDELVTELYNKEDGIYFFYRSMDAQADLFKEQGEKYLGMSKVLRKSMERTKSLVLGTFTSVGELPAVTEFNPIKVSKSAGSVEILDESIIPSEYFIEVKTLKLDKKRILGELKEGNQIAGVKLVQKEYLRGLK